MSTVEPWPETIPPTVRRVASLDNARYWVMMLVVVGHGLTRFVEMEPGRGSHV